MSRPRSTVSLHASRIAQINHLADVHGVSNAELVARWINGEFLSGVTLDHTPGFRIVLHNGGWQLLVGADNPHPVDLKNPRSVRALAMAIQSARDRDGDGGFALEERNGAATTIKVARIGRGVVVLVSSPGRETKFTLTDDLATDVVRQFRAAIGEIH